MVLSGCNDVRFIGNVISTWSVGGEVKLCARLVATGNHLSGFGSRAWWFTLTNTDCVIKDERNDFGTPVSEDAAPVRFVYEGLGDNGTDNPASAGPWNGISGRRWNGTIVRWNSGGGEKFSIFRTGVGWTTLN